MFEEPEAGNDFLADHVVNLLRSFHELTGRHLIEPGEPATAMARQAYELPFVLLSHDSGSDPVLTYGNLAAQRLFSMDWGTLVTTPSRKTAEAPERAEREELLRRVAENGFIDDYSGVRISADGRRFMIRNAIVWNLADSQGRPAGQAATFSRWERIDADFRKENENHETRRIH
jgi:hypothetical protein